MNQALTKLGYVLAEVLALNRMNLYYDDLAVQSAAQHFSDTVREIYGVNSPEYRRFQHHRIWHGPMTTNMAPWESQNGVFEGILHTVAAIEKLIRGLEQKKADFDRSEADWDDFLEQIGIYLQGLFRLSRQREKDTWMYILGLAAQLEFDAVTLFQRWADRVGESLPDYGENLTLGQATRRIEKLAVLDAVTIETMMEVARLRNSVAHKGVVVGVADSRDQNVGIYKGRHVFTDLNALKLLDHEVHTAANAIRRCSDELENPR